MQESEIGLKKNSIIINVNSDTVRVSVCVYIYKVTYI